MACTRHRAISLYKDLCRLGRDYPDHSYVSIVQGKGSFRIYLTHSKISYDFHGKIRLLFESKQPRASISPLPEYPDTVLYRKLSFDGSRGNRERVETRRIYQKWCDLPPILTLRNDELTSCGKETLALYSLRKYRHLKRMYPIT